MAGHAKYKPVSHARNMLRELMVPAYANFGGKVHGGVILSLMDKVAYTTATTHAGTYCVTASVDRVDFRSAAEVGSILTLLASVNYVGRSSMEIGIRVEAHDFKTGRVTHTNTSYFTMVALGEDGAPALVPGLILESPEDVRRFVEGKMRRRMRKEQSAQIRELRAAIDLDAELEALDEDRCIIDGDPRGLWS